MKNFSKKLTIVLMLICATVINAEDQNLLVTQKWTLIILNSQALVMAKFPQQKPHIQLQADNRFIANLGCNNISGSYKLTEPNVLEFSQDVVATKMACDQYFMDLEAEFIKTLPKVKYWHIKDQKALGFQDVHEETLAIFTNVMIY